MDAADSSSNKPSTATAEPPVAAAPDRTANATAASNVMSSLAGLGSTSSEDDKQKEKDVGGTSSLKEPSSGPLPSQQQHQPKQPSMVGNKDTKAALGKNVDNSAAAATKSSDVKTNGAISGGGDAMEVDAPTKATSASANAVAASKQPASTVRNSPKSQPLSSPSKPQQSAKMKARGIISTLEASADSAFASKPAALPSATTTVDGKKRKKDKDDKKKTSKKKSSLDGKKGKDKVKKKKVRLSLVFLSDCRCLCHISG